MKGFLRDCVVLSAGAAAFTVAFIILSLVIHGKVNW